jgi:IclR family acetate operon transcriptional repressor
VRPASSGGPHVIDRRCVIGRPQGVNLDPREAGWIATPRSPCHIRPGENSIPLGESVDTKSEVRVLGLFEVFARSGRAMQLTELAEALDAPVSSCFKLVRAVEQRGYLYSVRPRGALYPTRRLHDIGRAIFEHDRISPAIRSRMQVLRDAVGETTCLAQRRDTDVVYLEVVESVHSIRFTVQVGDTRPVHANSMGKAILSTLPADAFDQVLATLSYTRFSPRTLVTPAKLAADITRGRRRGWYCNDGETAPDALAAAVPVQIGGDWYGLSVVGPKQRMQAGLERHLRALRDAARDIEAQP